MLKSSWPIFGLHPAGNPPEQIVEQRSDLAERLVQTLMDYIEGGESIDDFLEGFPAIKREQMIAFLEEAKERMLAPVEIQRLWAAEAIRCRDEVRSGHVRPIPGDEVIAEVRRIVGR
jgi:hypothetical protein